MALTEAQQRNAEKNRSYWERREIEQHKKTKSDAKAYDKKIEQIYGDMLEACQNEINSFYVRYANKENITIAEAKKRVAKLDIERYEKKAKRYVREKNFSDEANEEMRLYNLTMKVNRLELLKANIGLELISGHNELQKFMSGILKGRTMDELKRQAGILGKTVQNNAKLAHTIPYASFHNATFSNRIWMYQDLLKAELEKLLTTALIQGKNPRVVAKELEKAFSVKTSDAERLMRTELCRVQTEAQRKSFMANGFKKYRFIVNGTGCPICKQIASKNDGVYMVKDMMPGLNAPPVHPNCMCSMAAYEDSDEYESWLNYLEAGGTTESWNKLRKRANHVEKSGKSDTIKLKDILIHKSVGAKSMNYDVMDLDTGEMFKFAEGTRLQDVEVFAGKGVKKTLRIAEKYAKKYGGKTEDWQHVKGKGYIAKPEGDIQAEVHWMQCEGVGKFDFFVKEWLE